MNDQTINERASLLAAGLHAACEQVLRTSKLELSERMNLLIGDELVNRSSDDDSKYKLEKLISDIRKKAIRKFRFYIKPLIEHNKRVYGTSGSEKEFVEKFIFLFNERIYNKDILFEPRDHD